MADDKVRKMAEEALNRLSAALGRTIVAPAGVLLTRVLYNKRNGKKTFVIVDAGMNDLMRPSLYGAVHPITRTTRNKSDSGSNGERVGNIQFGYRLCADGKHVVPDSSEQAVIAAIGDMRASGTSLRRIASDLNNRGFRTRRGSPWRLESIARVVAAERRSCSA